jgi:cation:H+ antiporter
MDLMTIIWFVFGVALLIGGAELLVRGASNLAARFGISKLIIGLTVVSLGTSAPEFAVSLQAGFNGQTDILLGNIIGSNIANILLVLGLIAMITPIRIEKKLIRIDVPIMITVSALLFFMVMNGSLERWQSILLGLLLIVYMWFLARENRVHIDNDIIKDKAPTWLQAIFVIAGLVLLVAGARFLVNSAVTIAEFLGVSELVIGLTVVAIGTSLPEVATSVVAALRGEAEIAVGNVVGSNIFNILFVLGIAGAIIPEDLPVHSSLIHFDIPFMLAATFACLPIFFTGYKISRKEGILFFSYFIIYITWIVLSSTQHELLGAFSNVMLYFVIPITLFTFMVILGRVYRTKLKPRFKKED